MAGAPGSSIQWVSVVSMRSVVLLASTPEVLLVLLEEAAELAVRLPPGALVGAELGVVAFGLQLVVAGQPVG